MDEKRTMANPQKYWFRRAGVACQPVCWQGWLLMALFYAAPLALWFLAKRQGNIDGSGLLVAGLLGAIVWFKSAPRG